MLHGGKRGWSGLGVLLMVLTMAQVGWASGPRWVTGPPYFWTNGVPVVWYTDHPVYFTDAGDLSSTVNHQAADAMVAAAAGVWNVPTSRLVLAQGGLLHEHVSGSNVTAGTSGLVFPADVQISNYQAMQIAVIYDSDGSVTDLMLGGGASDPSGCQQNGVTESVDSIARTGFIQHALLVVNGRCTGSEPEKQLQLQYQAERAFGRILGVAWSQTNDNVFTGTPTPTYNQALHWPIMHPIDILCGPYSYQCLPQPFMLRADDISSISQLYFIAQGQAPPGKVDTLSAGNGFAGAIMFPNGQGMETVNVVARRMETFWDTPEGWEEVSGVSGYSFRRVGTTPLTAAGTNAMASLGATEPWREAVYEMQLIPRMSGQVTNSVILSTQAVNPLYIGSYAIGPYTGTVMSQSGSSATDTEYFKGPYDFTLVDMMPNGAASTCAGSTEGTEGNPLPVVAGGWWTGSMCGYGHTAWASVAVKANRTLTLEVTGTDDQGNVSMMKTMPAIGVWKSTDATGTRPTVAVAATAFNGATTGLTTLPVISGAAQTLRIAVTDQRGAGRPDFGYQARVLYADTVSPAAVSAQGGVVTITGMGFRQGNAVLVNGVAAAVSSWTSTTIVATVPTVTALGSSQAMTANLTVQDPTTGGSTSIPSALSYAAPVESVVLVSAPSGALQVGLAGAASFAVKALAADGVTPRAGRLISLSAIGGGVQFGVCGGAATCTVVTSAAGIVSTTVTPTVVGNVVLTATDPAGTVTASLTAVPALPDSLQLLGTPTGVVTVGATAPAAFAVRLMAGDGVTPRVGQAVTFSAAGGGVRFGVCGAATCMVTTDAQGRASTMVTPTVAGTVTLRAATAATSVSASLVAAAEQMRSVSAPSGTATVGKVAGTAFEVQVVAGDGTTPVAGVAVVLTAIGGGVSYGACGGATCTLMTDASGQVSSTVTPLTAGALTLSAVSAAGTVTAVLSAGVEAVRVTGAPSGTVTVGKVATMGFAVKVVGGDGLTPLAGEHVTLSATGVGVVLAACGGASCAMVTDASGVATSTVMPGAAGPVTLTAVLPQAVGASAATASFVAAPETVHLVSAPVGPATVGSVAAGAFAVRVFEGDGVTPMAGEAVTLTASGGSVVYGVCGSSVCAGTTDATGTFASSVKPTTVGAIGLVATVSGAGAVAATLTAVPVPDVLRVVSQPAGVLFVGQTASVPMAVQILHGDGVTAVAGVAVSFQVTAGGAVLSACGAGVCQVVTDAQGMARTMVVATSVGAITISATATAGVATAAVTGIVRMQQLAAARSVLYVAEGATVSWPVSVALSDNGGLIQGVPVTWGGSAAGLLFAQATSTADAAGAAGVMATAGPLAGGVALGGTACAWGTVCTGISVRGVSLDALRAEVVSGDAQGLVSGGTFAAITMRITDGQGDPVAGASVMVHQTLSGWAPACGEQGRCPAAAVYEAGVTTAVSDLDGLLTVTPMQVAGQAGVTQIAAAVGTQGFVTAQVTIEP